MSRRPVLWSVVLAGTLLWGAPLVAQKRPPAPPRWTFFSRSASLSGLTPGAKITWFSISREFYDYGLSIRLRNGTATDLDNDGQEKIEIDGDLSPASIWAAVDIATGAFALATPSGRPIDLVAIHGNPRSSLHKIDFEDRDYLYAFLVRPNVGAWWARIGDGGPDDEDGESNRRIELPLAVMAPFEGSPAPPDRIDRDDFVFAIDPNRLEVFAAGVRE
ncbi:MAG TPA: hypothetical protein VGS22_12465 [Thermoanaerobaculia bacterium]|jgi:hypothetical protein|nr:hypothetical protein [Thermoanaerobaculia bacterium]